MECDSCSDREWRKMEMDCSSALTISVYMYVCIYVCMYVCMCVCVCVFFFLYVCIYIYIANNRMNLKARGRKPWYTNLKEYPHIIWRVWGVSRQTSGQSVFSRTFSHAIWSFRQRRLDVFPVKHDAVLAQC